MKKPAAAGPAWEQHCSLVRSTFSWLPTFLLLSRSTAVKLPREPRKVLLGSCRVNPLESPLEASLPVPGAGPPSLLSGPFGRSIGKFEPSPQGSGTLWPQEQPEQSPGLTSSTAAYHGPEDRGTPGIRACCHRVEPPYPPPTAAIR